MTAPGEFSTIVADPPWPFLWHGGVGGRRRNATRMGYDTMTFADIQDVRVAGLAGADATLLLWVTQEALHGGWAQRTAKAWGFPARVGELIWQKPNFGTGAYPRIAHETCVIYRRGKGSLISDGPRDVPSVQRWRQPYLSGPASGGGGKQHSGKPDGFYDFVEAGFTGPFLELFARRARFGWEYAGDGSLGTVVVPGIREAGEAA